MDLIIQPEEVGTLARPISQHTDREQLVAYITEVEQLQIRSALGGVLFSNIKQSPSAFAIILNGGIDEVGEVSGGIRKAMAYYVYARVIREGGTIPTRWGAVEKTDEYATRIDQEQKNTIYRECNNIADTYMAEVVCYAKARGWLTSEGLNPTRRMAYVVGDGITPKKSASVGTPTKVDADIVQGDGILINGNIISVDYSKVASMHIVEGVEKKANNASTLATEAMNEAKKGDTHARDAMTAASEAVTFANEAKKIANNTNTALTAEVNERKAEDAKMTQKVATIEMAISNLQKADAQLANSINENATSITTIQSQIGNINEILETI